MNRPRKFYDPRIAALGLFLLNPFAVTVAANESNAGRSPLVDIDHVSTSPRGGYPASFFYSPMPGAPIGDASLSGNGRYVVFTLTPAQADGNWLEFDDEYPPIGKTQVYVHDRKEETTLFLTRGFDGNVGNGDHVMPAISSNGRYVAFSSDSSNLVDGVRPLEKQVFLYDLNENQIEHLDMGVVGGPDGGTGWPSLSSNGRYVAFTSSAENLSPLVDGVYDQVYLHDRLHGTTELISMGMDGTAPNGGSVYPKVSANGKCVLFQTLATNIHSTGSGVLVFHRTSGEYSFVNEYGVASISGDCRFVAFNARDLMPDDNDGYDDVYVRDLETGEVEQIDVGSNGSASNHYSFIGFQPSISEGGRYVTFGSSAWNLVDDDRPPEWSQYFDPPYPGGRTYDVFIRDRLRKTTTCTSQGVDGTPLNQNAGTPWDGDFNGAGPSHHSPSISADGSTIAFVSAGGELYGINAAQPLSNQLFAAHHTVEPEVRTIDSGDQIHGRLKPHSWQYFRIRSKEFSRLTVVLDGLTENADLFVNEESRPTIDEYTCRSRQPRTTTEACDNYATGPTTWIVALRGRTKDTRYRLRARLRHAWPMGHEPTFADSHSQSFAGSTYPGRFDDYAMYLERGHKLKATLKLEDGGSATMSMSRAQAPRGASVDCADVAAETSTRRCSTRVASWRPVLWFVRITGLSPNTNYRLRLEQYRPSR